MCSGVISSARPGTARTVAVTTKAAIPRRIRRMDMLDRAPFSLSAPALAAEPVYSVVPAYDSRSGKSKEKPVIDHARRRLERPRQRLRVGNAAKGGIEDIVPAVGDERITARLA